jgi:diketogulonate reductase-like aldo/keto reductase
MFPWEGEAMVGTAGPPGYLSLSSRTEIATGILMPRLGLGTYGSKDGPEVEAEIAYGLKIGYRGIDTAAVYGNERGVGRALRASGFPREEVFVASKVWNADQGYSSTLIACEKSLARLELDWLDLYLVHWPDPRRGRDTWRAMEELQASGKTRAIGVCNHLIHHLEDLLSFAEIPPAVDQVEHNPWVQRPDLRDFCAAHGITFLAWAPVMRGKARNVPTLVELGRRHAKTSAQICIRWILQHGVTTIPKSVHERRIAENADVFDFVLSEEEMAMIDALDRGRGISPNPDFVVTMNWVNRLRRTPR